jgi:hypothetical protein
MRANAYLAATALLSGCANWTTHDTYREAAALSLLAVDYGQTRTIAKNPDQWYEQNPILGEHPSVAEVNRYFALAAIGHVAASATLPPKWRKVWQYVTIGVEAAAVGHNISLGIGVSW